MGEEIISREEREVIIQWVLGDKHGSVYGAGTPGIWRQCEKNGWPLIASGPTWREYQVPVECIRLRKKRVLNEKQKGQMSERMRRIRSKMPDKTAEGRIIARVDAALPANSSSDPAF